MKRFRNPWLADLAVMLAIAIVVYFALWLLRPDK